MSSNQPLAGNRQAADSLPSTETVNSDRPRPIWLALSGGGLRATLFHMGVVRAFRERKLLKDVKHITSVSGGSIFAAHLALNWADYSEGSFENAAEPVIRLARKDVRGRIVRSYGYFLILRFMLGALLPITARFKRLNSQLLDLIDALTPVGRLIAYYSAVYKSRVTDPGAGVRALAWPFGAKKTATLRDLRTDGPDLQILSTNVTEAAQASFTCRGLTLYGRESNRMTSPFGSTTITVPFAVAASSAFPAFFNPARLRKQTVAFPSGLYHQTLYFTDGGVLDNLGISGEPPCARDDLIISDASATIYDDTEHCDYSTVIDSAPRVVDIMLVRGQFLTERVDGPSDDKCIRLYPQSEADKKTGIHDPAAAATGSGESAAQVGRNDVSADVRAHPSQGSGNLRESGAGAPSRLDDSIAERLKYIRTDLDKFSDIEINALVRHGFETANDYLIARQLGTPPDTMPDWKKWPCQERPVARAARELADGQVRAWRLFANDGWTVSNVVFMLLICATLIWAGIIVADSVAWNWAFVNISVARRNEVIEDAIRNINAAKLPQVGTGSQTRQVPPTTPAENGNAFQIVRDRRVMDLRGIHDGKSKDDSFGHLHRRVRALKRTNAAIFYAEGRTTGDWIDVMQSPGEEILLKDSYFFETPSTPVVKVLCLEFDVSRIKVGDEFEVEYVLRYCNAFERPGQRWASALTIAPAAQRIEFLTLFPKHLNLETKPPRFEKRSRNAVVNSSEEPTGWQKQLTQINTEKQWAFWDIVSPLPNYSYGVNWE